MITFDFDDTLTRPVWEQKHQLFESSENPNYDTFAKLKSFDQQGEEIMIVTTRWSCIEIVDFVEKYNLPISAIRCTEGELKGETLLEIGSQLHFDDSPKEAVNNRKNGIPTMIVSYRFDTSNHSEICEFNLS